MYDEGKTSMQANGLMLRAAYPVLRGCTEDALVLPTATQDTIDIILEIAYLGRSFYPMPQLSSTVQSRSYASSSQLITAATFLTKCLGLRNRHFTVISPSLSPTSSQEEPVKVQCTVQYSVQFTVYSVQQVAL